MPISSSMPASSTSAAVFVLPSTKSGSAARSTSVLGVFTAPRFFTVSGRCKSNWVQVSSAAATRLSRPPARHQTSAKLPMRAAARLGCETESLRPRSSVKVIFSAGCSAWEAPGSVWETPGSVWVASAWEAAGSVWDVWNAAA